MQTNEVTVRIHESKRFLHTTKALSEGILLEFKDAPLSEVIDYLSIAKGLRFRFDSTDIGKQRVSISASPRTMPGLTVRDVLVSLFEHVGCEMALSPNGDILVRPASSNRSEGNAGFSVPQDPQQECAGLEKVDEIPINSHNRLRGRG